MPVATAPVVSLTVPVVTSTKLEAAVVVWPTDVAMSRVTCLIAFMIFSLSRMGPIPEGGGGYPAVHSVVRYILNPYQNFEIPIGVFVGKLAKLNESENLDTVDTQKLSTD